ncbi:MAG: NUDIX domain-containing protein [Propioniciclava sp.]
MSTPDFIVALRAHVGTTPLWLAGATACIFHETASGTRWLLARRADSGQWAPITGIVDPGEHPADTAVREAAEEAGVVVEVERLIWVDVTDPVVYDNGDVSQYINHTFRCRFRAGTPYPRDGENLEVALFAEDALPQMAPHHAAALSVAIANAPESGLGPLPGLRTAS